MAYEKKNEYLGGAAILALAVAITKVIGVIYKVPILNILGDEGSTHFQVTYSVYNLLLTLSTAGIPVAMSRLISASAALGRPRQITRYFRVGLTSFMVVGLVGMGVMLAFPQQLADFMGDHEISAGIRALGPAVLFSSVISVYRGYGQGFSVMTPTAISQIMESSCKLIFGVAVALFLSTHGYTSPSIAAGSIIGVPIGLGLTIPIMVLLKKKIDRRMTFGNTEDIPKSRSATCREIFRIGIPIMLSSSILNIITLIDTKLVLMRLQSGSGFSYETAKILMGVYAKAQTLFAVPSSFMVPVTVALIPPIAAAIALKNFKESRAVMESGVKLVNILALPAGVGIAVLSRPIFTALYYNSNENGPRLLIILGIASFFVCMQLITNAILQASGHEKLALISLPIGGAVKIIVNWFLVGTVGVNIIGAPIGTLMCYLVITCLNLLFIKRHIPDPPRFIRLFIKPAVCTAVMAVCAIAVCSVVSKLAGSALSERLSAVCGLVVGVIVAVVVYFILVIVTKTITREDMKFVPKGEKLAEKLKIK